MSKFIIKQSSIKEEGINQRYLKLIQDDLQKYVHGVQFEMAFQQGNFAVCESTEFDPAAHVIMSPDKLKLYIAETLNYRFENFVVQYLS